MHFPRLAFPSRLQGFHYFGPMAPWSFPQNEP